MPRIKPFATECHRCLYMGKGDPACLSCDMSRFGQVSKRGHTIVSLDALTELGGDIHRDRESPLTPRRSAEYAERYDHAGLVKLVAESLPADARGRFRAAWQKLADGGAPANLGALAREAGIGKATLAEACSRARARMEEVRRAEEESAGAERWVA